MRKVLLATTALVAMSVTAAQAADVSISGNQTFEVTDDGTTTSFYQDGAVTVKAVEAMDNGMTATALYSMSTSTGAGLGQEHIDDSYLDLAGEFGSIRMGNTDDALDLNDGIVPSNWDENGNGGFAIGGKQGAGEENISFTAPSISGVKIYGATSSEGRFTGMGINYSNGPVAVLYQTGEDGTDSESLVAVNFSMAGATVGFSSGDKEAAGGTKTEYTSMGVKYSMGDLDLYYVNQKDGKNTKTKTSLGGYYSIAPGLSAALETADDGASNTTTYAHLQVSF